jgi:putative effector of murein hydrolase
MKLMIETIIGLPIFGIALTLATYSVALVIARRINNSIANPTLIAALLVVLVSKAFGIPLESYQVGGSVIAMLILPATISLAVPVYEQRRKLKRYFLPIIVGCSVGAATSLASVTILSKLFSLEEIPSLSLLSKSVTAAIAMDLAKTLGADVALTLMAVMVTGISGVLFGPPLLKLFKVEDPILQGISMGTSSHVIGTSRAMEMGPVQGAISSVAIFVTGIATVVLTLLVF